MIIVPSKSGNSKGRHGYVRRYGRHGVYFPKERKTRLRIAYTWALSKEIFRKALKAVGGVFPWENKNGWQAEARQPSSHLTYPSEGTTKQLFILLDAQIVLHRENARHAVGRDERACRFAFISRDAFKRHISVLDDDVNRRNGLERQPVKAGLAVDRAVDRDANPVV